MRPLGLAACLLLACVVLATGQDRAPAAGTGAPRVSSAPLDPAHMRPLPAQGVAIQRKHDLLLLGLNGKPYGTLAGFKLAYDSDLTAANIAYQNMAQIVADRILVVHLHAHWYELDGAGLHALSATRIPLAGGTVLIGHGKAFSDGGFAATMTVTRGGHRLTAIGPYDLTGSSGGLLHTSAGTVLDPATGAFWRTRHGCVPAGLRQGVLLGLCPQPHERGAAELDVLSKDGGHRLVARLPYGAPYPVAAELSPNGRYVAAAVSFGCGPSYSFVVPAAGGQSHSVLGEAHQPFTASDVLGWSTGGSLVTYASRKASCEGAAQSGLYAVAPGSFARRLVSPQDGAMWNPVPH